MEGILCFVQENQPLSLKIFSGMNPEIFVVRSGSAIWVPSWVISWHLQFVPETTNHPFIKTFVQVVSHGGPLYLPMFPHRWLEFGSLGALKTAIWTYQKYSPFHFHSEGCVSGYHHLCEACAGTGYFVLLITFYVLTQGHVGSKA